MNTKKAIDKIKEVLNLSEDVKLAQMKLDNGTVLEADEFEADNEVFIVTEDEKVALPIGEYLLEDGKILVVKEEGLISEIKEEAKEEEEEKEVEAEPEVEMEAETSAPKKVVESITKEMFFSEIEKLRNEIQELKSKTELKEIPAEVKAELSQPAAEPIVSNPNKKETNLSNFKIGSKRAVNTLDRVMSRLSN